MKTLPLEHSTLVALVDDDLYDELTKHTWRVSSTGYVIRAGDQASLARVVMKVNPPQQVRYYDRDKLNCQRSNLIVRGQPGVLPPNPITKFLQH
jgi:hypothetical protein